MNRISFDVTPDQHQRLKAIAALQGRSIKELILESTLGDGTGEALAELETFIDKPIAEACAAGKKARTVDGARRKLAADKQHVWLAGYHQSPAPNGDLKTTTPWHR